MPVAMNSTNTNNGRYSSVRTTERSHEQRLLDTYQKSIEALLSDVAKTLRLHNPDSGKKRK